VDQKLPPEADAIWNAAGLGDLALRLLRPSDLLAVAEALARGEGYTTTGPPETADEIRASLAGFGESDAKAGFVVTVPLAFLNYLERDRLTDAFPIGGGLGALSPTLFPPDGRFLHLHDLWVDPSIRRRGVGRALKRLLEAEAAVRGVRMIYTVTEATHRAVLDLNAQLGYVELYRGPMWDVVERVGLAKYLA
jgi:ribosomal protein S18 acetylase RimI-like enzyme